MCASPQLENGYIKIANEFYDALCKIRITAEARCIFDFIIRKTWGFHKKQDFISLSQFELFTGIKRANVCRALKQLKNHNFIIKRDNKYSIIKNFSLWKPFIKRDNTPKSLSNEIRPLSNEIISPALKIIKRDTYKRYTKDNYTKERGDNKKMIEILEETRKKIGLLGLPSKK